MTEPTELSIPEIAELAGVSESAVRNWFDAGKIPVSTTRLHGAQRRRFATRASVEQFLATVRREETTAGDATSRPANTPKLADC